MLKYSLPTCHPYHNISPAALYQRFVTFFLLSHQNHKFILPNMVKHQIKTVWCFNRSAASTCRKFSIGYFKNRSAVVIRKTFEYEREVFFNPHKSVDIKLFDSNVTRIEISFAAMSKFSFLLINKDGITVHISLFHVPYFSKLEPIEGKRSSVY